MSTKKTKSRKGKVTISDRKREACRKNAQGAGRPGYRCIIEWRPKVESAWMTYLDENASEVIYPSKRLALAEIERIVVAWEPNPEREFRVTRV